VFILVTVLFGLGFAIKLFVGLYATGAAVGVVAGKVLQRQDAEAQARDAAIAEQRAAEFATEQGAKDAELIELLAVAREAWLEEERLYIVLDPPAAAKRAAERLVSAARTEDEHEAAQEALETAELVTPRVNPYQAPLKAAAAAVRTAWTPENETAWKAAAAAFHAHRHADFVVWDAARDRYAAANRACLEAIRNGACLPPGAC
jgi:hypothetical protein